MCGVRFPDQVKDFILGGAVVGNPAAMYRSEARKISVLLVDDDRNLNRVLAKGLQRCGFHVSSALTAAEGQEIIADPEAEVDILVMDLHLPDSWGAIATMEHQGIRPELPVIFISGEMRDDAVFQASATGSGVDFLEKPFSVIKLANRIRRVVTSGPV